MMIWGRIMLQFLFVITPWESLALTKKRRSVDYTGGVRSFRHISGSSSSLADWEVGLREAVLQALLRERYQDPNLRERLVGAPLIGRQDSASPFGDVVVLARGQVYGIQGGNFAFVQDPYRNDCDDCHSPRRCTRHQCQPWTPHNQEQLIALWTVKRLRHRDFNNIHRYEIEYTISPINSETREIVTRRGRFNYAIPGHVFVIKSHDNSINLPTEVYNRKIPQKHFKPDILIGVDTAGHKHVLHSYPGFYTHPVHPSNNQASDNLKENDLYNKLIETLAAKTSTTPQREVPHQIYMNQYGGDTKPASVANIPPARTSPLVTMTHPIFNSVPTKPTMLHKTTLRVQENTRPPLTTVHYFMPDGEEQLLTSEVNIKDMNELTTEKDENIFEVPSIKPNQNTTPPKPTKQYNEESNKQPTLDESTVDQLTKIEMTTRSTKPTKKYYKTKMTKPKTTKYTTPKTTYIKPQITPKKKTSTIKPKSTTTKIFTTSKSSPVSTSTTKPKSTTHISASTKKYSTSKSSAFTTSTTKPKSTTHISTSTKMFSTSKYSPVTTSTTKPKSTTHISTSTIFSSSRSSPVTTSKSTTISSTRMTSRSSSMVTTPTTTILKSPTKAKVSTTKGTKGTTKEITNTTKVTPAVSQRKPSTTLKTTSTTPISADSSKQTPKTSPSSTKKQTSASKSTVSSISSTLLHTTPQITQVAMSKTTASSTASTSQTMSKLPSSIYVTTLQTLSTFPTPTNFTQYDTKSSSSTTELPKSSSTTAASSTLEVTTELPITNQDIEEPMNFPKPTKPMEGIPLKPSDEPEPSNQISAPAEEFETTPYSNTLMTTIKLSAGDELENTTKTTLFESTIMQFMMELEKPTTTAMVELTKIMNVMETTEHTTKAETTVTIGEFHQPTERTAAERSTTSMTVQFDESTENVPNKEHSNKTETAESLPEIETTVETENIFTSTQSTDDNKLPTSIEANTEKLTQNMSNIEISTQESTTRVTTRQTSKPTKKQTSKTTKKQTKSSKKPTIVPNDFLIDAEPVKEPIHTKPAKQEYNLDDIFGLTIATTKPTLTTITGPMESDLAQQLFGEKMTTSYKVIYSNFYEPSTIPTLMKYDETTMNFQPLTSQSYETSISYKVNRPSDTSASSGSENILKVSISENTEDSLNEDLPVDKYVNSTTESGMTKRNFSTKKDFDELAMQLVNHARIIDYGSKTSRAKYKRRRTRKPKTRQLTRKRKKLETKENS